MHSGSAAAVVISAVTNRKYGCGSEAMKRAWVAAPPAPACPTPNCLESDAARASLTNSSLGSVAGGLRSCDVGSSEDLAVSTHSFASLMAFWYVVLRCVVGRTCVGHGRLALRTHAHARLRTHAHARRTSWG